MTTAAELLTDIQARGIELQPHGAALRFRPRDKVTPALLARLQAHKPELLRLLAGCPQALQPLGADGPQDEPGDGDATGWIERATAAGWELVRTDFADAEIHDLQPCPVCGCLERWQDNGGGWHCEACSPRTAGPWLRELAQRLRERYTRRAAG